ncbi:hypothetical protein ABTE23_21870, partial [Acinetobacter baumannii]
FKGTLGLLTSYENILDKGSGGESSKQAQDILEQTKAALKLEAEGRPEAPDVKGKLVAQLIAQEQFNGAEVEQLNQYL